MYIGIDHGTTAMRFATQEKTWKIPRKEATKFSVSDLRVFGPLSEIKGFAITYSMGDNFSEVRRIQDVENRGVVSQKGAGEHTGGGTHVFDQIKESGIPAVVIPGLHRGSPTDSRFKAYSHQTSPEKIGIAWEVTRDLGDTCVVCDVSSNTVTLLVKDGKLVGGFDACLFAPGRVHGALDLDAIRKIDAGEISANEGFLVAGASITMPEDKMIPAIAMFAAMECASMLLLAPDAPVALCGSLAESIRDEVSRLLLCDVVVYDEWCAAKGLSKVAEYIFSGEKDLLGLDVQL